jgi:hypothetical protein
VIVPGFGGFITNYEPAAIKPTTHEISPPRSYLVFNSNLIINDGLLANEISRKQQCSFDEAMHLIRREVTIWHERLKAGKTITLPEIGTFSLNRNSKIEFVPDPDQNFFNEAFGMTTLVAPPLQKRIRKAKPPLVHHRSARKYQGKAIRMLAWAAAITVPLIFAALYTFMNYNNLRQHAVHYTGFLFSAKPDAAQVSETIPSEPLNNIEDFKPEMTEVIEESQFEAIPETESTEIESINEPGPENHSIPIITGTEVAVHDEIQALKPVSIQTRAYHIIVGSFENQVNAQELANRFIRSGWNAWTAESSKGMHRVVIASYVEKNEAVQQLDKIREELNPNAWLLRF